MRAIVFKQTGEPQDVLSERKVNPPEPGQGQVLIKVTARPIQPADYLFIGGRYRIKPEFPQPAGLEGVGSIVECGVGVSHVKEGDRVAFRSPGTWAEFSVASVSRVYPVAMGVSDEVACQFSLNPLAAWGLLAECDLPKDARILITAGRSVVARLLVALALHRQQEAILLVRDETGYSISDGNSGQVIATAPTVDQALHDSGLNGRIHAVLDAVAGPNTLALIDALAPRGRLISYGVLDDNNFIIKASRILYKNMKWQGFGIDGWLDNASEGELKTAQQELWKLLANDSNVMPVKGRFALSRFQDAIRMAREDHQPGKVLLVG